MQLAMSSNAMKSLLKGLRYISQAFVIEGEKEPEMQIGNPTDVKHVAHIGWDGPSDTSTAPTWMNEFKGSPEMDSTPGMESTPGCADDVCSLKCQSEYGGRTRDLPKLPKSTRKSASEKGSPTKERSDKPKRRTWNKGTSSSSRKAKDEDPSSSQYNVGLPENSKKSKKKRSKEGSNGGSSRSSRRSDVDKMSDYMSDTGSIRSMSQFDDDRDRF